MRCRLRGLAGLKFSFSDRYVVKVRRARTVAAEAATPLNGGALSTKRSVAPAGDG